MNLLQIKNILDRKFAAFFILLIVSMGLIMWFFINSLNIHSQRVRSALEVGSVKVERVLADRIQNTYNIAKSINSQILKNPYDKKYINEILRKFKSTPELNDSFSWTIFSWSDLNDKLTVDAKYGVMTDHFDLSIRDYIPLTRSDPGKMHLGDPVFGSTSGKWMIPGGIGLVDKKGNYLGAVVIGFEIDALARSIHKNINNYDIEIEIINNNDISILEVDSKYFGIPRENKISGDPKISEALRVFKVGDNMDIKVDLLWDKKAFLIKELDNLKYLVILKYNQEFINHSIWESLISGSLEILVMFLVSVILLALVYRIEKIQRKLIKAKNAAENANKVKDGILFSISHDIKNYIFGIGGLGRMVIDPKDKSEVLKSEDLQIVETICDQAEELKSFVEDLLDVNHVEAGGLSLGKIRSAKLRNMINIVIAFSKSLALDNKVSIRTEIEGDLPQLNCDPRRIKQILINLINNAIKYSKMGGEVVIVAKHLKDNNHLLIEINDSGFGMNEEGIAKYLSGDGAQIDKSDIVQIKDVDSHGIGVPIALRLIELHNGRIEVSSGKNIGTKVKIYFNLSKPLKIKSISENTKFSVRKNQTSKPKNKLILLVEDNPVNIKITCKILELGGYKVIYAENGKDALRMIDKHLPDLILMDGEMPVMNGYDATRNIRSGLVFNNFKKFKTIPIIGLMSSSNDMVVKRSIESGMNDHMEKSTSRTKLLDMIESSLI